MKKLSVLAAFAASLALPLVAPAQQGAGLSSMGQDFYLTEIAPSFRCSNSGPPYILISSPFEGCRVTIDYFSVQGIELTGKTFTLHAKQSLEYPLEQNSMNQGRDVSEVPTYASCHIYSDRPISVSYYSDGPNSGALTLILPTSVLGKSYVIATLPANPGVGAATPSACAVDSGSSEFAIVAVRDTTTVTITTNGLTRGGHVGVNSGADETGTPHPFQTMLQHGEVYWVKSTVDDPTNDMTGSTVTSSWPVAVFAGNGDALNGESSTLATGGDQRNMLMQEMIPTQFWRDSGYISIPFVDPPDLGANNASEGEAFKFFTSESHGTTVNFTVNQLGTYNLNVTPFQIPPAMEENVMVSTTTASQNGAPIMVEQYDYRGQGSVAPFSAPTMMNVVPLQNFATTFAFMVPRETSSTDNMQYLNMILRRDQYTKVKVWRNDSALGLAKLTQAGSIYSIPGHSELEGVRFQIPSGNYYISGDSAFMVYQYGMLTNNNYYYEYAAPTGEMFHIEGAGMPTVLADTLCEYWNVTARDTATLDGGIASIELLNDSAGILLRRPGMNSGYVSTNVRPVPTNFTVNPGDTASSFDIVVNNPTANATAWILVTNKAGNSQLLRLFYAAQNLSFLSTQQPASNLASFIHSRLDVDTCTQLVLKNLAAPGGKPADVTGYHFIKGDTAFSVTGVSHSLPFELASGDSIVFNVCFDPVDTNAHSDSLMVETDCLTDTAAIISSAQVGIIIAGDWNFGTVPVGDTVCHDIVIQNLGTAPLVITSQSVVGNSTDFTMTNGEFPDTIPPSGIVSLRVCFIPQSVGQDTLLIHWGTNRPEPFTHEKKDSSIIFGNGILPRLSVTAEPASPDGGLRLIPSGNQLNILLPAELEGARISIFDEIGRELRAFESKSQTESLDVADLPSGTYYLRASKGNIVKTAVFIIAH